MYKLVFYKDRIKSLNKELLHWYQVNSVNDLQLMCPVSDLQSHRKVAFQMRFSMGSESKDKTWFHAMAK